MVIRVVFIYFEVLRVERVLFGNFYRYCCRLVVISFFFVFLGWVEEG